MSAPRDAPARDVDARARGTDERERGSSASRGTTTDENAAPERDGAATSGRDAVKDVEDGFTRFNLGAGDAGSPSAPPEPPLLAGVAAAAGRKN